MTQQQQFDKIIKETKKFNETQLNAPCNLEACNILECRVSNNSPVSKQAAPIAISSRATSALEPFSHTAVTLTWNLDQSTYHLCI